MSFFPFFALLRVLTSSAFGVRRTNETHGPMAAVGVVIGVLVAIPVVLLAAGTAAWALVFGLAGLADVVGCLPTLALVLGMPAVVGTALLWRTNRRDASIARESMAAKMTARRQRGGFELLPADANLYAILDVGESATQVQLDAARLRSFRVPGGTGWIERVEEAHSILSDPELRDRYDRGRSR